MFKEYKTIREVVGPLMLVDKVEGVSYNELVEIRQENGEIRKGKVLEVNGDRALVQLFEGSQGLKISTAKARFWEEVWNSPYRRICLDACLTVWENQSTAELR